MNKSFDIRQHNNNESNLDFDELLNNSIDVISQRILSKHQQSHSKERSTSIPKLNFSNVKEFQD